LIDNPYLDEVKTNLSRLLSMPDQDITRESYGIADRYYWTWSLIDFGNETYQKMVYGFFLLWENNFWPYKTHKSEFLNRIDALFYRGK
jgi:hypothetical protein